MRSGSGIELSAEGEAFVAAIGIDTTGLKRGRARLCRECLDWSARRAHLAGSLGRALLSHFEAAGWARRGPGSRAVRFSPEGERRFRHLFPAQLAD